MSQQAYAPPSGQATRRWLAVIVVAFLVLGLIYSVVVPLFEAPDEVWHFAFADHLAKGGGLPVFNEDKSAFLREGGQPPLYYAIVALAIAPFDRADRVPPNDFPGWVRFNSSHPAITPGATSDTPNVFVHTAREDAWTGSVLAVHVARLVSLLFGALTVVGVYCAGRAVTGREDLALSGAALVAFTPQFVFISASVNNDSLMAATATWVGVAALELSSINFQFSKRYAVGAGIVLGLGLLAKLGGLILLPLMGLAFLIRWSRHRVHLEIGNWKLVFDPLIVFGVALLVSGWWFIRNMALYGDPLGWSVWLSDIGVRTPTPALWQLVPEFPALFKTFWVELPGFPLSGVIYIVLAVTSLVALIGLVKCQISNTCTARRRKCLKSPISNLKSPNGNLRPAPCLRFDVWNLTFILLWFGIVLAAVVRYMQTTPAAHGRLLFPALAPIGVLMAIGLDAVVYEKRAWLPGMVAGGLFILTVAAPFVLILPAFAKPVIAGLPADARPMQARFGDRVELIGARLPDHVEPGGTLHVTTYWRALQDTSSDQRLLIRLMRPDGSSAGQLDTTLGTNLYPTTLWRPGQIVMDAHDVRADADLAVPQALRVHVGVGDAADPLLPVTGPQAWSSGDVAELGLVQVTR
jgi:4-amino-4-deoxy-L-arabinose transferase-like glycosyltransferase